MNNGLIEKRSQVRAAHQICSGEYNGQPKGRDDDACREEYGELLAGAAHGVRVVHQPPGYAVRDGREDVKEEDEEGPVFAGKERGVNAGLVGPDPSQHTNYTLV